MSDSHFFKVRLKIFSIEVVYFQHCLVVTWLVPRETTAVSACSVYTIQPCTVPCHFMQSHLPGVHAYLAVTFCGAVFHDGTGRNGWRICSTDLGRVAPVFRVLCYPVYGGKEGWKIPCIYLG